MTMNEGPEQDVFDFEPSSGLYHRLRASFRGDTIAYAVVRTAAALGSFAMVVVLSRLIAPSDLGQYTLLMNTATLTSLIGFSWLGTSAFRYSAEFEASGLLPDVRAVVVRLYVVIGVLLAALGLGAWAVGIPFVSRLSAPLVASWMVLLGCWGSALSVADLLRAEGRRLRYSVAMLVLSAGPLAIVGLGELLGDVGVVDAVLAQAVPAAIVFAGVGGAWLMRRPDLDSQSRRRLLRRLSDYGWPLVAAGVCSWGLSVADRYALIAVTDSTDVGIYTVGYQLATAPLILLYSVVMFPLEPLVFSRQASTSDPTKPAALLGRAVVIMFLIMGVACAMIIFLRDELLSVFPREYQAALPVIPWAASGMAVFSVGMVWQHVFTLSGKTREIFKNLLIASLSNLALNLVLIQRYGVEGAAMASLGGYSVFLVLTIARGRKGGVRLPDRWLARATVIIALVAAALYLVLVLSEDAGVVFRIVVAMATVAVIATVGVGRPSPGSMSRFILDVARGHKT